MYMYIELYFTYVGDGNKFAACNVGSRGRGGAVVPLDFGVQLAS